jgi:hypothetical protein
MSYNTLPIDLDKEKLRYLLVRLSKRILQREEAVELQPILEKIRKDAIKQGDPDFASEIAQMIIALDGYIHGRIELVENVPISERLAAKKISRDYQK